jgi:hypothetical protein
VKATARTIAAGALLAALAGCVNDAQIRDAINGVNNDFRVEYERVLAEKGQRVYALPRKTAFDMLTAVMQRLGMHIGEQASELGYLYVFAPAPAPLAAQEWQRAAEADLPRMREIATRHVGFAGQFLTFEPEGLEIVINGTVIEVAGGTEISLTMRMREYAPPKSGRPRREYAPPTAVRLGLDKIWTELERDIAQAVPAARR